MRRLKEHHGSGFAKQLGEGALSIAGLAWQKALERESIRGQPTHGKRCQNR